MKARLLFATAIAVGATMTLSHARDLTYAEQIAASKAAAAEKRGTAPDKAQRSLLRDIIRGGQAGSKAVKKEAAAKAEEATPETDAAPETETRTQTITTTRKSGGYHTIVARYAAAYGVPTSLADAVVRVESSYRAGARGAAGEVGLMQIKPATARMMGYSGSVKGLYDPDTNVKYGMKYLAKAHQLGDGSTCGTILRYNAGHAARSMNSISAAYCSKVKRLLGR